MVTENVTNHTLPKSKLSNYLRALILQTDDTRYDHFMVQVISFARSLSDTSKHRVPTMSFSYVVDQFHDKYSLADTSTTKQTWYKIVSNQGKCIFEKVYMTIN